LPAIDLTQYLGAEGFCPNSPSRMRDASFLRKPSTLKLLRISNALNSRFQDYSLTDPWQMTHA